MASWWEEESTPFGVSDRETTTDLSVDIEVSPDDSESTGSSWWESESSGFSFDSIGVQEEEEEKEEEKSWWEKESENVSEIQTEPAKPVEAPRKEYEDALGELSGMMKTMEIKPDTPKVEKENLPYDPDAEDKPKVEWLKGQDPNAENPETGNPYWKEIKEGLTDGSIALAMGSQTVANSFVGLMDMVTFGETGRQLERIGWNPNKAREFYEGFYSESIKEGNKELQESDSFIETAKILGTRPDLLANKIQTSVPGMIGGAKMGKATTQVVKGLKKYGPVTAAAIGEGLFSMGSTAEDIRLETGGLTAKQIGYSLQSGLGTTAFSLVGGRLAKKMGIEDIDTFLAKGSTDVAPLPGLGKVRNAAQVTARIIGGGVSEGVFEELPQSAQETIWMNAALGKPLTEGLPQAMAEGLMVGAATGGPIQGLTARSPQDTSKLEKQLLKHEKALEEGRQLAQQVAKEPVDNDAQEVQPTTEEKEVESSSPYDIVTNKNDRRALDRGENIVTVGPDGNLIRRTFGPDGRVTGSVKVGGKPVITAQEDTTPAHLRKGQPAPLTRKIPLDTVLETSDQLVEKGNTVDEIIRGIEAMVQPSTAEESAQVFEAVGETGVERAAAAAEVLEGAPLVDQDYRGVNRGAPSDAQQAGEAFIEEMPSQMEDTMEAMEGAPLVTQPYEGRGPQATTDNLAAIDDNVKSARESAEVFIANSKDADDMLAQVDSGQVSPQEAIEKMIAGEAESAQESAETFTTAGQAFVAALDDANKKLMEGKQQEAIADIKRAVKRKGKNAEKSAAIFEAAPQDPATGRVKKAQADFKKAFDKDDQKGMDKAAEELDLALKEVEKKQGVPQETVEVEREAAPVEEQSPIQVAESEGTFFDEETGTPNILSKSPEDIQIEKDTQQELESKGLVAPAPSGASPSAVSQKKGGIDAPVQEKVQGKVAQGLVQSIIDGDVTKARQYLKRFPADRRQKAFAQAQKDAMDLAVNSGIYDVASVEANIEEVRPFSTARAEGSTEGELKINADKTATGVWTVHNTKSGKKYDLFSSGGKYYIKEKGKGKESSEFDSREKALDSVREAQEVEYDVRKNSKAGKNNQWEVYSKKTGKVVDPGKRTGGTGYFTQKEANAVRDDLNRVESTGTQKVKKKTYSKETVEYAEGKAKKGPKQSKPEKASKRPSIVRRRDGATTPVTKPKRSTQEQTDPKKEKSKSGIEKYDSWISKIEKLPDGATAEDVGKAIGNPEWKMDKKKSLSVAKMQRGRLKKRLESIDKTLGDLVVGFSEDGRMGANYDEIEKLGVVEYVRKYGKDNGLANTLEILEGLLPEGVLNEVDVELVTGASRSGIPGEYMPRLDVVMIYSEASNGRKFSAHEQAVTMLHELVHAVTYKALEFDPDVKAKLDKLRDQVADKLLSGENRKLFDRYKDNPNEFNDDWQDLGLSKTDARTIYMMLTNDEFLANATHPAMRQKLETVAINKTQFEKWVDTIKDAFKKLFGFTDTESNAFLEVMGAIGELNDDSEIEFELEWEIETLEDLVTDEGEIDLDNINQRAEEIYKKQLEKHPNQENYTEEQKESVLKSILAESNKFFKDVAIGINERLEAIHPQLASMMRMAEAAILRNNKKGSIALSKFQLELNRHFNKNHLSQKARDIFFMGLYNNDKRLVENVINAGPASLRKAWKDISDVRDNIQTELLEVGSLQREQLIKDYMWHREVKDLEGLMDAMAKDAKDDPEAKGIVDLLEKEIEEFSPSLIKQGMTQEQAEAFILERVMRTGKFFSNVRKVRGTKMRSFDKIPARYMRFYKDPFEAMANHIEESNEVIQMRRMMGTAPFRQQIKKLQGYRRQFEKATGQDRDNLYDLIQQAEFDLARAGANTENGISFLVQKLVREGRVQKDQINEVSKLVRARVNQIGITSKFIAKLRNLGLATTLGHISNTMTQLKDGSLVLYRHGLYRSTMSMVKVMLGKASVSAKDYDLQRVMNEFRGTEHQKGLGKYINLQTLFRATGFTALDNFMKSVNVQSHYDTINKATKNEKKFRAKYEPKWGTELVDKILYDMRNGNVTDDVKNVALTEVARDVPIFLSEMPVAYNTGGNARFFYTLKSYAIKIMNVTLRDGLKKIATGTAKEKYEGIRDLTRLALIIGLVGGGVEELKDWMIGRQTPFWENVGDELLSLILLNRYSLDMTAQKGPSALAANFLSIPALNIGDAAFKLAKGDITGLKYVPGMKEFTYRMTSTGIKTAQTKTRETIFGKIKKDTLRGGKLSSDVKKQIRKYNTRIKHLEGDDAPKPITFDSIKRARQRYKKEAAAKKDSFNVLGAVGGLLISPVALGYSYLNQEDKDTVVKNITPDTNEVIKFHAKRLGYDYKTAAANLSLYADLVSYAESRNDPKAANPKSTARGLYQFLEGSIDEAIKRTAKYTGMKGWMKEAMAHRDASKLTPAQQTLLFMGNFLEMKGSDEYAKRIFTGDIKAMTDAYYKLHHTKPDAHTIANWEKTVSKLIGS